MFWREDGEKLAQGQPLCNKPFKWWTCTDEPPCPTLLSYVCLFCTLYGLKHYTIAK